MKTLIAATALVLTAGIASASTAYDFDRFGVDAGALTNAEVLTIQQAINGGNTDSEVKALVQSIVNG